MKMPGKMALVLAWVLLCSWGAATASLPSKSTLDRLRSSGESESVVGMAVEGIIGATSLSEDNLASWWVGCQTAASIGAEPSLVSAAKEALRKHPRDLSLRVGLAMAYAAGAERFPGYRARARQEVRTVVARLTPANYFSPAAVWAQRVNAQARLEAGMYPWWVYGFGLLGVVITVWLVSSLWSQRNAPTTHGLLELSGPISTMVNLERKRHGVAVIETPGGARLVRVKPSKALALKNALFVVVPGPKGARANTVHCPQGGRLQYEGDKLASAIGTELVERDATVVTGDLEARFTGLG